MARKSENQTNDDNHLVDTSDLSSDTTDTDKVDKDVNGSNTGNNKTYLRRGPVRTYATVRIRELARNKRRTERRRTDKQHRAKLLKQSRENRRSRLNIDDCKHIVMSDVDDILLHGNSRLIISGARTGDTEVVYTVADFAKVLGNQDRNTIYRWTQSNIIPPMINRVNGGVINDKGSYRQIKVYTKQEVIIICQILRKHQIERSCNFSTAHTRIIDMIEKAINKERSIKH
jgi:hypothetical protein